MHKNEFARCYSCYYAVLVVLLAIFCTYHKELFLYQRTLFEEHQIWRLFSGHFSHLNNKHLLSNLLAWSIIFILGFNYLSIKRCLALLFVLTLSISLCLYYYVPTVVFYGGLSGVLHGYFAYILVEWIKRKQKLAWLILFLLLMKVLIENFSNGVSTGEYLDIRVISEVHIIGTFVGIFTALLIPKISLFKAKRL